MTKARRGKLIRDYIPAIAKLQGRLLNTRTADPSELARLLGLKLLEESHEAVDALWHADRDTVLEELADVQAVIDAIAAYRGLSTADIRDRARRKHAERGGFDTRLVLCDPPKKLQRLHQGGSDSLLDAIQHEFRTCVRARVAVSFVMNSGIRLLEGAMRAAQLRGATVSLLTTDYLGVTEPDALRALCGWPVGFEARVYCQTSRSFHPKAWMFERADGSGRAFIGSSNISRSGLVDGVEWTWSVLDVDAGDPMHEIASAFDDLFSSAHTVPLTLEWIDAYEQRRKIVPIEAAEPPGRPYKGAVEPRPVQTLALQELQRLRADGERRALVVAATGLGKTFLAAFDSAHARKVLFIAHRRELLQQAAEAYANVYPDRSRGFVVDGQAEYDRDVVFASVQTVSNPAHLQRLRDGHFDYVVVDEFHHAAAESYSRVLAALDPAFLLGLTATPFRSDNRDLLALCDGNLAYQVGLLEAIGFGWLVPFHYFGIADSVQYSDDLLNAARTGYDASRLTPRVVTLERIALVIERYRAHPSRAALGFCVSIEHAKRMAAAFNAAGIPAAAVHSGEGSLDRAEAIASLAAGRLRVLFTVDLFNEGVDIPVVDLVLFLRPTESMTIFVQQLGRGLRLHRDKPALIVLDFIGNYRNAHVKLSLLAGHEFDGASDRSTSASALTRIQRWLEGGTRPDGVPDGVLLDIEPVALSTLRDSLRRAMPQREAVLQAMTALAGRKGRAPSLKEWVDESGFKLGTALKATGTDRWISLLGLAALATDTDRALDEQVGEFLKEIERTSMTRSFKMVVLEAMLAGDRFRDGIGLDLGLDLAALVSHFRERFAREGWRSDVAGTEVEAVDTVSDARWRAYLLRNPIAAWVGSAEKPGSFFRLDSARDALRYIGPVPPEPLREAFHRAIADRTGARLLDYWRRPGPGRFVFPVIPTGAETRQEGRQRSFCIMFGNNREGLPAGWHVVRINDRTLYGKFVKVALNKVAETPHDDAANRLTAELTALFGGRIPNAARVRMVREAGADVWRVERA